MGLALIFPPHCDFRAPQLANPSLKAWMEEKSIPCIQIDANIEAFHTLMNSEFIVECLEKLNGSSALLEALPSYIPLNRQTDFVELLSKNISKAIDDIRSAKTFYDPGRFHFSREVINCSIRLVGAAYGLRYSIGPLEFSVDGYDTSSIDQLDILTRSETYNPFQNYYENTLIPQLHAVTPSIVGITLTNEQQWLPGLHLARRLKRENFRVILGGALISKFADELVKQHRFFDMFCEGVVVYEGEQALSAILNCVENNSEISDVPNYISKNSSGGLKAPKLIVEDVGVLPTPSFSDLNLSLYLSPEPVLPILFGKGCFFNRCRFCEIPFINQISKKAYRVRSAEQVHADITKLNEMYGARSFVFTDETIPPKFVCELSKQLKKDNKFNPIFSMYGRLDETLTDEMCSVMSKCGVRKIFFGLESGSQKTLDAIDKGYNLKNIPSILKSCKANSISYHVFSIVGFPGETRGDADETYQFFEDNPSLFNDPSNSFDIHQFTLDTRSEFATSFKEHGIQIEHQLDAEEPQFPLEVKNWKNLEGLSPNQASTAITEYSLKLRELFQSSRSYPSHFWPTHEEYSILYKDAYFDKPFNYSPSIYLENPSILFCLKLKNEVIIEEKNSLVEIISPCGYCIVSVLTMLFLSATRPSTYADIRGWGSMIGAFLDGGEGNLAPPKLVELVLKDIGRMVSEGILACETNDG